VSAEVGNVGEASPTSAAPVSAPSLFSQGFSQGIAGMNPFSGLSTAVSTVGSSVLSNWALVAVGVVLAVGALLISQKETVVQIASKVAA
jgi:hypothetical protein